MSALLGTRVTQFFAYVQLRRLTTIRTGDLLRPLGVTPKQERELLSSLSRQGLIARVRRGLYLVPERIPAGGAWSPGEYLALSTLMEDCDGAFQISGPNAFYRYGWDDQIPNRTYVYNNRLSGDRRIGRLDFTLIKVADSRLGATDRVTSPEGEVVYYSSRARTLVDAICDWRRFGSLPRAYEWIRSECERDSALASQLVTIAIRYGNMGTRRRLGYLLESLGAEPVALAKLEKRVSKSTATIPWVPGRPKTGTLEKRWRVIVNE